MISYSRTRRQHGTKLKALALVLVLAGLATLFAPAVASPNAVRMTTFTQPTNNDTLIASPWVQEDILDKWQPDTPRFWCVGRSAEWDDVVFILDMRETTVEEKCKGPEIVFAHLPTCPPAGTKFSGPQKYMIVECGPWVFRRYSSLGGVPSPKTLFMESA